MRIVFGARVVRDQVIAKLKSIPGIDAVIVDDVADVVPLAAGADAIVISDPRGKDGAALVEAMRQPGSKLRWVQVVSAGYEGLAAHGVPSHVAVTNQGGAVSPAVAEHAMALILAMARQIGHIIAYSNKGEWNRDFKPPIFSVEKKTLVVVGMGNIGRQLARRAKAFEMEIIGVTRSGKPEELAKETLPMTQLSSALGKADVVVITAASSPETRHLINATTLAATKRGALLVNVSRGELIDQVALRAALESGQLGGAAIDVTDPEPLPAGDPLWGAPNLIVSPHTAGAGSAHTGHRVAALMEENLSRLQNGKDLLHRVI